MGTQNNEIQITYGNKDLKEILNQILKEEFIKLANKENGKV